METKTRQQKRAEERKLVKSSLSKSDRKRLSKMKKGKRKAIFQAILDQANNNEQ